MFAEECFKCKEFILDEGFGVGEQFYHSKCISCGICGKQCDASQLFFLSKKPSHLTWYLRFSIFSGQAAFAWWITLFSLPYTLQDRFEYSKFRNIFNNQNVERLKQCTICKTYVDANEEGALFDNKHYHIRCLRCVTCKVSLLDQKVFTFENNLLCENHYLEEVSEKCAKCDRGIAGPKVNIKDKPYHKTCIKCTTCDSLLVGTGKGVHVKDGKFFCKEHFQASTKKVILFLGFEPLVVDLS